MRRGLKLNYSKHILFAAVAARAAPYEKGTETQCRHGGGDPRGSAARAAPYEKGTETQPAHAESGSGGRGRARGPL